MLNKSFRRTSEIIKVGKYNQAMIIARFMAYMMVLCVMVVGGSGCATHKKQQNEASARSGASHAEKLYQAILVTYAERGLDVDIASEELLLVSSRYEKVGSTLRRRYISRVLGLKAGIALNVSAEYQRGRRVDGEERWQLIGDDDPLKAKAAREEVELGRAVERAFHK